MYPPTAQQVAELTRNGPRPRQEVHEIFRDLLVKRGLLHVSELSHAWVKEPRDIVKAGQIVKVKVLEVDTERGRVNLSMKAARLSGLRE